jgi:hypothetical protein
MAESFTKALGCERSISTSSEEYAAIGVSAALITRQVKASAVFIFDPS